MIMEFTDFIDYPAILGILWGDYRIGGSRMIGRISHNKNSVLSEWVEFNAPPDTRQVISEAVFTANHLTDTDKQSSTGK